MNEENLNATSSPDMDLTIDHARHRYPFCLVWTPLPLITYVFPFIGHVGIATSSGVIRDFAGPYTVSEDAMAFGWPTRYWQLNPSKAAGGAQGWDNAVFEASEIYKGRMHNLFCDNCHSHVGQALSLMNYDNSSNWNMVKIALYMFIFGKFVGYRGLFRTWVPFILVVLALIAYTTVASNK